LAPNPASTQVKINTQLSGFGWRMSDLNGREIQAGYSLTDEALIDVSSASKGLYIITIEMNGVLRAERLIID